MFYVTSEIYLNNDLGSLAVSVDNYPQKRKNHLTITYIWFFLISFLVRAAVRYVLQFCNHVTVCQYIVYCIQRFFKVFCDSPDIQTNNHGY